MVEILYFSVFCVLLVFIHFKVMKQGARGVYFIGMISELVIILMIYGAYLLNIDAVIGTLVLQAGVIFAINIDIRRGEKNKRNKIS